MTLGIFPKLCRKCRELKAFGDFCLDRSRKDGFDAYCKDCKKRYVQENQDHIRNYRFQWKFGTTLAAYNEMLAEQGGVCAICGEPETAKYKCKVRALALDHDHDTGKVRALLCKRCNTGIAIFEENPGILNSAISYINKFAVGKG